VNEEPKTPPTIEDANAQLVAAQANEEAAVLTHEKAGEDLEATTVACISAPPGKLDAAISAKIRAREKLSIVAERLSVARGRSAAAATALHDATVDAGRADLSRAEKLFADADADALALVRQAIEQLAPALSNVLQAKASRDAIVTHLAGLATVVAPTPPGPVAQALKIHRFSAKEAADAIRAGTFSRSGPTIDAIASITAILTFIAAEPANIIEAKANAERNAASRASERSRRRMQGYDGPEARDEELDAVRASFAESGTMGRPVVGTQVRPHVQASVPVFASPNAVDDGDLFARDMVASRVVRTAEEM